MINYFELNWLAKKDRHIQRPLLIFSRIDYGGCYYLPLKKEILIDGHYYPLNCGLIIIQDNDDAQDMINTMAHEWRHHWQVYNNLKSSQIIWDIQNNNDAIKYKEAIIDYFSVSSTELDALLFSAKVAPCEIAQEWIEWLIQAGKLNYKNKSYIINHIDYPCMESRMAAENPYRDSGGIIHAQR